MGGDVTMNLRATVAIGRLGRMGVLLRQQLRREDPERQQHGQEGPAAPALQHEGIMVSGRRGVKRPERTARGMSAPERTP